MEGLVLKLKLQYFGHLRAREEWDEIVSITDSIKTNLSKPWEIVEDRGAWYTAVHGIAKELNTT